MTQEAKVRVRIDTAQAKADLQGLTQNAAAAGGRIGDSVRSAFGRGIQSINPVSGVGGATASALRSPLQTGVSDVVGEAFGGWGVAAERFFLGDMGAEARAARSAREDTIATFGTVAGMTGRVPQAARNYFEQLTSLNMNQEKGRMMLEEQLRTMDPGSLVDRLLKGIGEELAKAVERLREILNPFDGK